jgi:hypothetical protein
MTLAEQLTWLAEADNISKVRQCTVKAAVSIMAEAANTANHTQRIAYAFWVLNNPVAAGQSMAYAASTNPGLTTTPTDNDLEFTINSMVGAMAGVAN